MSQAVNAVQYLRMSTEHQRYSLENQAAAIAEYARENGFKIVRSYFDPGKSGLTLKARKGLKALLSDALRKDRDFEAILVLDVSRWGRFQDVDQSAHYEYLCREAGAKVIYCGEPFDNDGSAMGSILKQMKRIMAAEYSRELSEKISRAHLQQARLGFHQGGCRTYGFDRAVIDSAGNYRFRLEDGQQKALTTDRVVLVPGPPEELSVIRRIFHTYVDRTRGIATIVRDLNAEGIPAVGGRRWTRYRVWSVLQNEQLLGIYTYNRSFQKMGRGRKKNPPASWVRVQVMNPLISPALFRKAGQRLRDRPREGVERAWVLRGLKRLLRERGFLSQRLINACPYLPHSLTIAKAFGSVGRAYEKIGYVQLLPRWTDANGRPASDEDLLDLLRSLHQREGRITVRKLAADQSMPSAYVYQNRFGSLSAACQAAEVSYGHSEAARTAHGRAVAAGTAPTRVGGICRSRFSNDALLKALRRLHARDGFVSSKTINVDPEVPTAAAFRQRFGSLLKAYELAGLPHNRAEIYNAGIVRRTAMRGF